MPNEPRDGPIPRIINFLLVLPSTMNPAIRTLSPVSTRIRVEMLARCEPEIGVGLGVEVGVAFGVDVGEAAGVGVEVEPGVGVGVDEAPGVAVGVAVAPWVAVGVGVGVGPGWAAVCTTSLSP